MEGPDAAAPADRFMSPLHGRHGSTANQALSSRDESQGGFAGVSRETGRFRIVVCFQ